MGEISLAVKFKRHSDAERTRLHRIFQHERAAGKTVAEIALALGVSVSTVLRWQREESAAPNERASSPIMINAVISGLLNNIGKLPTFELLFNICCLNVWLRWPCQQKYHYSGLISTLLQYVSEKFQTDSLQNVSLEFREGILQSFSLRNHADLFSPQSDCQCDFTQHRLGGQKYTELDVAANLAWYFIACPGNPKVNHAFEVITKGVNGLVYDISWSKFQELWRLYMPSSAFIFVQNYNSSTRSFTSR